ncbi:nuclear envelope pore membrane protein POM 121-like isoform X1 [Canis lupus familiaris]|uniref:nuclear envelope pore membrane protein POM 121-like isoform X1 n=1 Tax=Canis lupus familiaris TaxID=9615 RepID=UPI0018F7D7F2|nr:nuclear envelope pore membrane protein POM 121-like isoform X1 [Canis lupus familiaris]
MSTLQSAKAAPLRHGPGPAGSAPGSRARPPAARARRPPTSLGPQGGPAVPAPASTPRPSSKRPATRSGRSSLAAAAGHSVILWTLRSLLGLIAWVRRRGGLHRAKLSAPQAQASLTCASVLGRLPAYVPQLRLVTPGPTSAPSCAQDVSAGKTAWRAREEQEDPALTGPPDARRRCAKGSGAAQPAFGPFRVDTSPRSFVPRPGPLHRSLPAQGSDDAADKESHPAGRSSCRHRNAISSSYSSTREVPSAQRRRAPATRQGWPPPTPPDKVSPHSPWRPAAPSVPCQMENQRQEEAGATTGQKETCRNRSPTSHCSRPRRRKMPLLPHRPGDPVRLPPAPVLGFRVTAQDLDAEKRAALQRIDRALRRGDMEGISRGGLTCPCSALPWPAARAVVLPAVPPAPGLSAQRAEQDSPRPLAVLPPGGGAVSVPPLSQGEPSSPGAPSSLSRSVPPAPRTLLASASCPGSGRADLSAEGRDPSRPAPCSASGLACALSSPAPGRPIPTAVAESLPPSRVKPGVDSPVMGGEGGGSLPTKHWVSGFTAASCAFPTATSTDCSRRDCPSPMSVDCPAFSSQSSPPTMGPRVPTSRSLPVTCAVPPSPSSGTSGGLAAQPASDVQVTSMDCTPPCMPLLLGSPRGSSGSFYPPAQGLPMPSRDSMGSVTASTGLHALGLWSPSTPVNHPCGNSGTPAQPTLGATDGQCQGATTHCSPVPYGPRAARATTTARALTSALGQLSLGSATQEALGGSSPTSCTSGTHAGTQPGCAATPAVVPPGTATAPGSVTNAGSGSWQPCPIAGATSPAPLNFGVAAAPAGLGRRQAAPDQRRSFGAHSVTPQTSGAPSSTHRSGDSFGPNTRGYPRGSTPNTTARASTKHNPVSGGPNAPPVSPSPRDLAAQRPPRPSPEPSSTAREATCRVAGLLGPTPRGAASVLSTARNSPARPSPSSAAPGSGSRKRAAPGHKSFPDTSQSTLLGSRTKMLA